MDKGVSTVVAALISAAATIIVSIIGLCGPLRRENSQLQTENTSLQEEISVLQEQTPDTDAANWQEQVSNLQSDLAVLQSQIEELQNDNAGLKAEKERLAQENEQLKQNGVASPISDSDETAPIPGGSYDLLTVCPPYETSGYDAPNQLPIMGTKYRGGFYLSANIYTAYAFFNLGRQYSRLEFDVGHVDASGMVEREMVVYLDGEEQDPITLRQDMPLTHYAFSVSGITQFKLEIRQGLVYGKNDVQYGFVNAKLYA